MKQVITNTQAIEYLNTLIRRIREEEVVLKKVEGVESYAKIEGQDDGTLTLVFTIRRESYETNNN